MKMRYLLFPTVIICTFLLLSSCSMFEMDDYEEPSVSLSGKVIDAETGDPVLTDQGAEGIRIRLTELSWGDNVEHNPDFFCKPDGTFQNDKLFEGYYNVRVDGPFIPLLRKTEDGDTLADKTENMKLKDADNEIIFEVQPFLKVEWVDEPKVESGKIKAKIKVNRGVSKEEFENKIEPMGNYNSDFLNVTDVQLFVSYSSSVGYRNRDERWSSKIEYSDNEFDAELGETIKIESSGDIPSGRTIFVRVAARINYDTPPGSGTRRWNYNESKRLEMP